MSRVFNLLELAFMVMDLLTVDELRVYGRTNKVAYDSVKAYFRKYHTLAKVFRDFLPEESWSRFHEVQRQTGTLIGGSAALKFFTRQKFTGSAVELYVHGLFAPDLIQALLDMGCSQMSPRYDIRSVFRKRQTRARLAARGITHIYEFLSPTKRRLKVVMTFRRPVEAVIHGHSSASTVRFDDDAC